MLKFNHILHYSQRIQDTLDTQIERILNVGINVAKANVGVDTGQLYTSIHPIKKARNRYGISAGAGLPDERAIYNNYGTAFQAGTAYMDKAALAMAQEADSIRLEIE